MENEATGIKPRAEQAAEVRTRSVDVLNVVLEKIDEQDLTGSEAFGGMPASAEREEENAYTAREVRDLLEKVGEWEATGERELTSEKGRYAGEDSPWQQFWLSWSGGKRISRLKLVLSEASNPQALEEAEVDEKMIMTVTNPEAVEEEKTKLEVNTHIGKEGGWSLKYEI